MHKDFISEFVAKLICHMKHCNSKKLNQNMDQPHKYTIADDKTVFSYGSVILSTAHVEADGLSY